MLVWPAGKKHEKKNTLVLWSCISLCFYTIHSLNDIVKITTLLLQEVRFTLFLKICICSFSFLHVGTKKLIFPKKYEMAAKISTYRIYLLIQVTSWKNLLIHVFCFLELRKFVWPGSITNHFLAWPNLNFSLH